MNSLTNNGVRGLPEKTPNPEANSDPEQDLEGLAAEVLNESSGSSVLDDIVDAEIVPNAEVVAGDRSDVVEAEAIEPAERSYLDMPPRAYATPAGPVNFNQKRLQTKGGAVAGVLLGILSMVGAFLTSYSLINAFLGLVLSTWGMGSGANRLASAGVVLSIIGLILSFALGVTR